MHQSLERLSRYAKQYPHYDMWKLYQVLLKYNDKPEAEVRRIVRKYVYYGSLQTLREQKTGPAAVEPSVEAVPVMDFLDTMKHVCDTYGHDYSWILAKLNGATNRDIAVLEGKSVISVYRAFQQIWEDYDHFRSHENRTGPSSD